MKVVIIGGGTAGSEVAWRLRQQDKEVEITILEKSGYTQYSPCALPYVISREIERVEDIFLFDQSSYKDNNIELKTGCEVTAIERKKQQVHYKKDGDTETIPYDRLVITTGCRFSPPDIPGLDQCSYSTLTNVDDARNIKEKINSGDKALIIGVGYIGMELAGSLYERGLEVTVVEAENRILPANFDERFSSKIRDVIEGKRVQVITEAQINRLGEAQAEVNKETIEYDHLFVCCGLAPDISLASQAGLECGKGIIVDEQGRTSDKNIYTCGDAVESINFIDNKKTLSQLATTAVRQAQVVAKNILGGENEYPKVLNTNISEFDDLIFGSTGVTENYCRRHNIDTISATCKGGSRAEYHPKNKSIWVKIIADKNARIIGCQIAGYEEVAGRLNTVALAIGQELYLDEFLSSETCYNPAIVPIFDPLHIAAEICKKKLDR